MNYPILVTNQADQTHAYLLTLPDMPGCQVTSDSIENGFEKLKIEIKNHLDILVEYGEQIPTASKIENHSSKQNENFYTWLLIEIDILPYLGKSHKINVTLPELLIQKIDHKVQLSPRYKTRSHFIAQACIQELKKEQRQN